MNSLRAAIRSLCIVLLLDAAPGFADEPAPKVRIFEGHKGSVLAATFSPDGKTLATGSRDGTIKLWNPQTGEVKQTLEAHAPNVYAVEYSPKGDLIASCGGDKTIKLWDAKTLKLLRTLKGHTDIVRAVTFSPDQKLLASASVDLTVRLWDVATGELKKTMTGHTMRVKSLVWTPDGKTIISGASDPTIRFWDVASGTEKNSLHAHEDGGVETIAISPDGKTLASSSHDTTVRTWDIASAKPLLTLKGHTEEVDSVAFSPDGKLLISGSKDKLIKIWNPKTGELMRTLTGHTGRIESLNFSPDSKTLVTGGGGGDTSVRLWDLSTMIAANEQEQVLFTDSFDGKLDSAWSWLREDSAAWKIEKNELLIRTSTGGLWMKHNNNRNLLLRAAPPLKEGRLAVEVRIENEPTNAYEHAALFCYYDDDSYALLGREMVGNKPIIHLVNEIEGKPKVGFAEKPWPEKIVWLRMELSPGKVRGLYRATEQDAWQLLGECDLPAKGEMKIALATGYAKEKEEHWSRFSKFRIVHAAPH